MATPEEYDRAEPEARLAANLSENMAEIRAALDRGEPIDWQKFEADIAKEVEDELALVFAAIFFLMRPDRRASVGLSSRYAAARGRNVAQRLRQNARGQLNQGLSPQRVLSDSRARTIAVTEITVAISAGETAARREEAMEDPRTRAKGIDTIGPPVIVNGGAIAVWQTAEDEKVCPVCGPLNGKPQSVFASQFPTGPPAHPNCRCWLRYVPRK